jgi:Tfp pilus assembly protein PilF
MRVLVLAAALLLSTSPSTFASDARDRAKEQVKFGIEVAQHNLWREAIAKFERAAEIDPTYHAAWNNLAIAYEQHGDLDKASKAYEQALKLDPDNQYIKQNYDLFREIHDRTNRRRGR